MNLLDRSVLFLMLAVLTLAVLQPARAQTPEAKVEEIDFARSVLPILSEKCFLCHGPDSSSRQAELRLDTSEGAREDRYGRIAVVPGNPEESLLVQRIHNVDAPMPPAASGKKLTDAERTILTEWIRQGAEYSVHWGFVPLPTLVNVPLTSSPWVLDEIDEFVLTLLNEEGLAPSKETSRERWLRRVTYDVTGLPPTPDEVDSFLAEGDYGQVVERLLASPRYGERMAVWWLDAARYGDSYGYQSDLIAPVWPYRDWVIRAFNDNKPYDQFLKEQIAGDLIPDASREQILATAFNRLHRMTNEGGSIAEEWKTEYAMDRTETFSTAFLGMTVGCARCHDHKFDPLTQKEYFQLFAYFNSIDEFGMLLSSEIVPTPSLLLPTTEQEPVLEKLRVAAKGARDEVAAEIQRAETRFQAWMKNGALGAKDIQVSARVTFDSVLNSRFLNEVNRNEVADRLMNVGLTDGRTGKGIVFNGDDGVAFRGLPGRERWDAFSWSFWVKDEREPGQRILLHRTGGTDVGFCGFDLTIDEGRLMARVYRHWPGNAVAVRTVARIPTDEWIHVGWTWDGSGTAGGLRLYIGGREMNTEVLVDSIWKTINAYGDLGIGGGDWTFGARFRDLGFKGGQLDDVTFVDRSVSAIEMYELAGLSTVAEALTKREYDESVFRELYVNRIDTKLVAARDKVRKTQEELAKYENAIYEVPVMRDSESPIPSYILARGQYDAPKNEDVRVSPGVPGFLVPLPLGASANRLGLAEWAIRPDHPLTARVFVNRVWQALFGDGLVRSSENFGILGDQPSHPGLLDYLSRSFVDSGWDVKTLIKKIVLSATYRQDSRMRIELAESDPNNVLLARGPSHRLDAEMVRDTVLFASGLLDGRLGGPPVNPYQPSGIWTDNNSMTPRFVQSKGPDLYRRSLYTTWKRTTPAPNMLAFDGIGREVCVMRRAKTSTPMQALTLLNDVQFVEAARVLAERVLTPGGERALQVKRAFKLLAARSPTQAELDVLVVGFDEQFGYFRANLANAIELASVGERPRADTLRASEVAAMTVTVQTIMNMDAVVWKR